MRIQEWLLAIAIGIIFPLFFGKLAEMITGMGKVREMCNDVRPVLIDDEDDLISEEGVVGREASPDPSGVAVPPGLQMKGKPNPYYQECYDEQREERKKLESQQFYILMGVGIFGIIIGMWIGEGALSTGLSMGSIITLFMATSMYWDNMNDMMKLGVTGMALVILVFVAFRFTSKGGQPSYGF